MVTWSGLTTDHDDSRNKLVLSLVGWSVQDFEVSVDNVQNIHHLSLVLVNSLYLNIEHGVNWNIITCLFLDPSSECSFILFFNLNELVNESLVGGIWRKLSQIVKSSDPLVNTSKSVTDELRELWVAAVDPSSWGNTVSFVLKFSWI